MVNAARRAGIGSDRLESQQVKRSQSHWHWQRSELKRRPALFPHPNSCSVL